MPVTLTTYSTLVHQDGQMNVLAGPVNTFVDSSTTLVAVGTTEQRIGIIFDLSTLSITDLWYPSSMTLKTVPNVATSGVEIKIYVIDDDNPLDYHASRLPGSRGEAVSDQLICKAVGDMNTGTNDWTDDQLFTFNFGQIYGPDRGWVHDGNLSFNWMKFVNRRLRAASSAQKIALSMIQTPTDEWTPGYYADDHLTEPGPAITVSSFPAHTGFSHVPGNKGRSVHDTRSGLPAQAHELVEDGFNPGSWVRQEWWDPEEPEPPTLPDTEGKVFDEVPD